MSAEILINLIGVVAGVAGYHGWAKFGFPWLKRKLAYKRRVATRRSKKVKGGGDAQDNG